LRILLRSASVRYGNALDLLEGFRVLWDIIHDMVSRPPQNVIDSFGAILRKLYMVPTKELTLA
jgi:hypothetical protein